MINDQTDDGFDPNDLGLDNDETARILGKKPNTLATWRSKGKGPRFRKIGARVEYTRAFIKEYQDASVRIPEPAAVRRRRRAMVAEAT